MSVRVVALSSPESPSRQLYPAQEGAGKKSPYPDLNPRAAICRHDLPP